MIGHITYIYKSASMTYKTYYLTKNGIQFGPAYFSMREVAEAIRRFE